VISEQEDLRALIRASWNGRQRPAGALESDAEAVRGRPTLRQRLFQRALRSLETTGGGTLDRARIRAFLEESPEVEALSPEWVSQIEQELVDEAEGLGPVAPLLRDPTISDVLVNGPEEVWIDRFGRLEKTAVRFDDEAHLRRILRRMVALQGRRLDEAIPWVDLRLPDGSRLNAVLSPVSLRGSVISIRRARERIYRLDELVAFGTLTAEMAEMLTAAVRRRRNLVVSGGAGAGKTTLLNVLSRAIPPGERIVTIEETAELRLEHPHVVPLEARPANAEGMGGVDLRTLVRNALRMRADRIIVGSRRQPDHHPCQFPPRRPAPAGEPGHDGRRRAGGGHARRVDRLHRPSRRPVDPFPGWHAPSDQPCRDHVRRRKGPGSRPLRLRRRVPALRGHRRGRPLPGQPRCGAP
jgi:Flp pilus assembly CpaF family ATPase